MNVTYPIFAFEKDDKSICLVESESRILHHFEAIDIENDEYVFWDLDGNGVSVAVTPSGTLKQGKLSEVTSCPAAFPIQDAFKAYVLSLGLPETVAEGAPLEVWSLIQTELGRRPRSGAF